MSEWLLSTVCTLFVITYSCWRLSVLHILFYSPVLISPSFQVVLLFKEGRVLRDENLEYYFPMKFREFIVQLSMTVS